MRSLILVLAAVAALASPAAAQEIGGKTVLSDSVVADAAAWTDLALSSMDCVSELCVTTGQATFISLYSSGAAVRVLLRGESGEATSAAIYIPSGGSLTIPAYGTGTTSISIHGDGATPTVYIVAGRQ